MASDSNSLVPDGAGRTIREELVVDVEQAENSPALRNSRNSVSASDRLLSALALSGEQRQAAFSRTTATAKLSGASAEPDPGPADPGPRSARCPAMGAYASRWEAGLTSASSARPARGANLEK